MNKEIDFQTIVSLVEGIGEHETDEYKIKIKKSKWYSNMLEIYTTFQDGAYTKKWLLSYQVINPGNSDTLGPQKLIIGKCLFSASWTIDKLEPNLVLTSKEFGEFSTASKQQLFRELTTYNLQTTIDLTQALHPF